MSSRGETDRVLVDLIRDLLAPEPEPKYEQSAFSSLLIDRFVGALLWFVFLAGLLFVLASVSQVFSGDLETSDDRWRVWWFIMTSSTIAAASGILLAFAADHNRRMEHEKISALNHSRQIHQLRTQQRTELLQHISSADVQRAAYAIGAQERALQRGHELTRDRQAQDSSLKELKTNLSGELKKVKTEIKAANPSASTKAAESFEALKGRERLLTYINKMAKEAEAEGDEVKAQTALQMHEALLRGQL